MRNIKHHIIFIICLWGPLLASSKDIDISSQNCRWDIFEACKMLTEKNRFKISDTLAQEIACLDDMPEHIRSKILCADSLTIVMFGEDMETTLQLCILSNQENVDIYFAPPEASNMYTKCSMRSGQSIDFDKHISFDAIDLFLLYLSNWQLPIPNQIIRETDFCFHNSKCAAIRIIRDRNRTIFIYYPDIRPDMNIITTSTYARYNF